MASQESESFTCQLNVTFLSTTPVVGFSFHPTVRVQGVTSLRPPPHCLRFSWLVSSASSERHFSFFELISSRVCFTCPCFFFLFEIYIYASVVCKIVLLRLKNVMIIYIFVFHFLGIFLTILGFILELFLSKSVVGFTVNDLVFLCLSFWDDHESSSRNRMQGWGILLSVSDQYAHDFSGPSIH